MRPLLILLFGTLSLLAQSQDGETPLFKAGASDVRVDVQVLNEGKPLTTLTKQDFVVYDNNKKRAIVYFGQEREPLSLLLLLDASGSMGKYIDQLNRASRTALRLLKPGDQVSVMVFGREPKLRLPLTKDLEAVSAAIPDAVQDKTLGSGTAINTAIMSAARYLRENATIGRRAILIVTDNLGINYQVSDEGTLHELQNANTVLNAIVVGKGSRPDPGSKGRYVNPDFSPSDVFRIAEETGGEALLSDKADVAFPDLLERIRTRYSLNYTAPEGRPGEFRTIRVELAPEARGRNFKAVVRARKGYYVAVP